ncbi:MAG: hypothetical protein JO061_08655 [Acidobacteriaceae bacterium]|nr:hypothetical protein [Acidobacteriaceae bacterium]
MSAAAAQATVPLYQEGTRFWQELTDECRAHVEAINLVATSKGISPENLVQLLSGLDLFMRKPGYPSTEVKAALGLFSWGPVIQCHISGARDCDHRFLTHEFEMPIARDLDGKVVAIFDEGLSFSPREVACYLTQSFRRCFPSVTLPCG